MAVAVDTFVCILEQTGRRHNTEVIRADIAGSAPRRGLRRHLERTVRVLGASQLILRASGNVSIYVSVDAGVGMIYTLLLLAAARVRRRTVYLHHHAADYLVARKTRFAFLRALGQCYTHHVVGCEYIAQGLRSTYQKTSNIRVLPITYAVEGSVQNRRPVAMSTRGSARVVVGHLSNLSVDKGLVTIFETADAIRAAGHECELLLAGPPQTASDEIALGRLLERYGPAARHLGPVYGGERDRFFEALDIFLFPSIYRHESFGLVAGEALVRGCPVAAYRNACLRPDLVGKAGLILDPTENFAKRTADWISGFCNEPHRQIATLQAAAVFHEVRDDSVADAFALAAEIVRASAEPPYKEAK